MDARKIDLFLLGRKGEAALSRLVEAEALSISSITGARDSGVDDDRFEQIQAIAQQAGIPFATRAHPPGEPAASAIAIGWRWLIAHDYRPLVVLHDSLLPRYRGFNPLVSCLINQEPEIGVTALIATDEYDKGPILAQRSIPIAYPVRISQAIETLLPLYAELAVEAARMLVQGKTEGIGQDEAEATYSLWRDEEDYWIDWQSDAVDIHRFVWAMGSPYKGAATRLDGQTIRIVDAEIAEDAQIENRTPGKVIFMQEGVPTVVCGSGLLRILRAEYDDDKRPVIPLSKFRSRFC